MRSRLVVIVGLAILAAGTARAEHVAVEVNGAANAHARSVVETAFASVFEHADLAERLHVVVTVAPDTSDTDLVLTASLDAGEDEALARSREPCQACTDALLEKTARSLAKTMLGHAQRFAPTTLAVTTDPSGATVLVDGKRKGPSPVTIKTKPGEHTVVVEQDGFVTAKRHVDVEAGKQTPLEIQLRAEATPEPSRPMWPLILVGAGVTAAGVGTYISYTVEPPPPTRPQPKYLYSGPGIGVAVVGVVAAATGVFLYLRPTSSSRPVVSALPGGGAVGWAGAF